MESNPRSTQVALELEKKHEFPKELFKKAGEFGAAIALTEPDASLKYKGMSILIVDRDMIGAIKRTSFL